MILMTKKIHINTITKGDNIQLSKKDFESIFEVMDGLDEKNLQLINENKQLKKEKHKLQQALLWYFDIAIVEYSSTYDKDMEHGCKILFGCSHDEAEEKYSGFEKTETYRELQKEY